MKLILSFCLTVAVHSTAFAQGALPKEPPIPKDNPQTAAKIALGKQLFFDPRLSSTGNIACVSCHNVMGGGEDNLAFSVGVRGQLGGRSSPTVWNSALFPVLFWDGRATSLEEQAKGPLTNPVEMGMKDHDAVMKRVEQIPGYVIQFKSVFKDDPKPVSIDNLAKAIAAYERTLLTQDSPYDLYLRGNKAAISDLAKRGLKTVQEVGCLTCHSGSHFSGPTLPAGTGFYQRFPLIPGSKYDGQYKLTEDFGRYTVTKSDADKHLWRVPSWRNVAVTAPYFHNGAVKTLDEAVRVMAKTQLNQDISQQQVEEVVAFLTTLTGKFPEQKMPQLPPTLGSSLIQ